CVNRCSNDVVRTAFTPDEICELTMEFYRRNYIEGLFLSSGVMKSADYTMEKLYETVWKLRTEHRFRGYIHVKAIPGADSVLIEKVGFLADRMSINLELPTSESLKKLCPGKSRENILLPMRRIRDGISENKNEIALRRDMPKFVPAGQSTQMIIGATPESDFQMVSVAQALYRNYRLKRVFYSAFVPVVSDSSLPAPGGGPPLLREHRLYQADWLLRFYGFTADELLSEARPNFNVFLDPKCDWAVRHLELFPVEAMTADYATLLRVPGVGVRSAQRILIARRTGMLTFPDLKKMGVVLKRAVYFLTCGGRTMMPVRMEENYITSQLIGEEHKRVWEIENQESFRQLSMFKDWMPSALPEKDDGVKALYGEL
ncbi:MAG: putative DNA modification/repair radical SAM protein, partial [Lachnospiraceae bacterium]|nr:putative DNA modification/repair radical SAM protein [Lachnospiraceae bacterium]